MNNTQNVQFDQSAGAVYWDNDKEGNYWSSYNGTDRNNDGIGDAPYTLGGNNTDRYPLMQLYVPQTATFDAATGQLFFTLAITAAATGTIASIYLYVKFKPITKQ